MSDLDPADERPVLRVVRGEPSALELAALISVLAARGDGAGEGPVMVADAWSDRTAGHRRALHPSPGAWARSLRRT